MILHHGTSTSYIDTGDSSFEAGDLFDEDSFPIEDSQDSPTAPIPASPTVTTRRGSKAPLNPVRSDYNTRHRSKLQAAKQQVNAATEVTQRNFQVQSPLGSSELNHIGSWAAECEHLPPKHDTSYAYT